MPTYVAMLRGINVGPGKIVKMERLRTDDAAGLPEKQERLPVNLPRLESLPNEPRLESLRRPARFVLPGEVFQAHLEN